MQKYTLQCTNTRTVFHADIADIVFDKNIIYRLHPVQTCYVGMEYAKNLEKGLLSIPENFADAKNPLTNTYATYRIHARDRKDNVCFMNRETREEFVMDPCDIVLSETLIEGFDSMQAFHIGVLAGVKMHHIEQGKTRKLYEPSRRPYLWVVK